MNKGLAFSPRAFFLNQMAEPPVLNNALKKKLSFWMLLEVEGEGEETTVDGQKIWRNIVGILCRNTD